MMYAKKETKTTQDKILLAFYLVFLIVVIAFVIYAVWAVILTVRIETGFEQYEQVEVVEKRISVFSSNKRKSYTYFVTFKFPDGAEKELNVGLNERIEWYDYINEGDSGILTYKEIKNSTHSIQRSFINFSKNTPALNE